MFCATEPRVGGGRAKKRVFLKYINLNSKLDILDNFPKDGTIFPTASKKSIKKLKAKKFSGGAMCTPTPRHLAVKEIVEILYERLVRKVVYGPSHGRFNKTSA